MKKLYRFGLFLTTGLLFSLASCDKQENYPENSILGTWRCFEEVSIQGNRQYNVGIDYQSDDSSTIVIYNFYNMGFNVETYATVQDTLITIIGTDSFDADIIGTGHVKRDFSAIYWDFSYSGNTYDPQVEAVFFRP
ncbi:MAG: hypothetical protein ACLFNU_09840 [Bacteroidales bacterium]